MISAIGRRGDLKALGMIIAEFNNMNNRSGISNTIIYKVFCKNYDLKKGELVGVLTERRKDLRGRSRLESASRWAKLMFGDVVKDKHAIFVVPDELKFKKDTEILMGQMLFNGDES